MGTHLPLPKGAQPPILGPYLLWPNIWLDQDATWYKDRRLRRQHCIRWGPSYPPSKKGTAPSQFSALSGLIKMPLGTEVGLGSGNNVLDGGSSYPPLFGPCLLWPNSCPYQLLLSTLPKIHAHVLWMCQFLWTLAHFPQNGNSLNFMEMSTLRLCFQLKLLFETPTFRRQPSHGTSVPHLLVLTYFALHVITLWRFGNLCHQKYSYTVKMH